MPKPNMNDILKRRMAATQQASELQTSDEAYQQIFREKAPISPPKLCNLSLDKLVAFSQRTSAFVPIPKKSWLPWQSSFKRTVCLSESSFVLLPVAYMRF